MIIEFSNSVQMSLLALVGIIILIVKKGRVFNFQTMIWLVFCLYMFKVIQYTIFPIMLVDIDFFRGQEKQYFNLSLFYSIYAAMRDHNYIQIIGNVLLFSPLGFLVPFLNKSLARFYIIVLIGFMGSLLIETTQLLLHMFINHNRLFDLDDLLLNTLGSVMGYSGFIMGRKLFNKRGSSTST